MQLDLSDLETLRLFNEKVDKLEGNSFAKYLMSYEVGIILHKGENKHMAIKTHGPTAESIDAFVLTFRYFIQEKERICITKLPALYAKLPEHHQNRAMFRVLYKEYKDYQKSTSDPIILQNGKALNKREIMHAFIYGDLSHMDEKERPKYMGWMKNEINGVLMKNEFIIIMGNVLNFLIDLQQLNDLVIIEELSHFDIPRQFSLMDKDKIRMLRASARIFYI